MILGGDKVMVKTNEHRSPTPWRQLERTACFCSYFSKLVFQAHLLCLPSECQWSVLICTFCPWGSVLSLLTEIQRMQQEEWRGEWGCGKGWVGTVPSEISREQRRRAFSRGGDKRTLVSKAHLRGVCFLVFNVSQTGERKDRKTIKQPLFTPMEGHLLRFEAVGKNMDWNIQFFPFLPDLRDVRVTTLLQKLQEHLSPQPWSFGAIVSLSWLWAQLQRQD